MLRTHWAASAWHTYTLGSYCVRKTHIGIMMCDSDKHRRFLCATYTHWAHVVCPLVTLGSCWFHDLHWTNPVCVWYTLDQSCVFVTHIGPGLGPGVHDIHLKSVDMRSNKKNGNQRVGGKKILPQPRNNLCVGTCLKPAVSFRRNVVMFTCRSKMVKGCKNGSV